MISDPILHPIQIKNPSHDAIYRAAAKGRVFAPFWSEKEFRFGPFWSGIGCGL